MSAEFDRFAVRDLNDFIRIIDAYAKQLAALTASETASGPEGHPDASEAHSPYRAADKTAGEMRPVPEAFGEGK